MKTKIHSLVAVALLGTSALAVLTGCAGDRYHESTGEQIDDTAITGRVKDALNNDPSEKYPQVRVMTFKGIVQLSGFADDKGQKAHAELVARNVAGVREVQNNITVKPQAMAP